MASCTLTGPASSSSVLELRFTRLATTPTGSAIVTVAPVTAYSESAASRTMVSSAASSSADGVMVSTVVPLDAPTSMVTLCVPLTE